MVRQFTCIMCPLGCELSTEIVIQDGAEKISVTGNTCKRGREYAIQELTDPRRNIATSVLVIGGELPLASVRLDRSIPKNRIFDVMNEIKKQTLHAPVNAGDIIIENILDLGSNVIATKSIKQKIKQDSLF